MDGDVVGCLVADRMNRGERMQCNPRKRIVFGCRSVGRSGGLVELGIFMSNGRAEPENGIGESGGWGVLRTGGGWKNRESAY